MRHSYTVVCTLALVGGLWGCGDDAGGTPDGAVDTGTPDAMADTSVDDSGPMGEMFSVVVVDPGEEMTPLEGVTVEVSSAAGSYTETTGPDGSAVFASVVVDGAEVSVGATGRVAATWSQLTPAFIADYMVDGALQMPLGRLPDGIPSVTISGAISGGDALGEYWTVTPSPQVEGYFDRGAMYSVRVPPDTDNQAVVLEFDLQLDMFGARAARSADITTGRLVTLPPTAVDATVDVDLSMHALTVQTATGSYPTPPAGHPLSEDGSSFFIVADRSHPAWYLGESRHLAANEENTRMDYEANWVQPTEAAAPYIRYIFQDGPLTVVTEVDGWPADGDQAVTYLDVLDVVSPVFGEALGVGDSVAYSGGPAAHPTVLQISEESDSSAPVIIWQIFVPEGRDITLPEAPAGLTVPGTALGGRVTACEVENPGPDFFCRRTSTSRAFDVEL